MVHDAVGFQEIFGSQRVSEFIRIVVLADPDVSFNIIRSNSAPLLHHQKEFCKFVADFAQIVSQEVGKHLRCLRGNGIIPCFHVILNPCGNLVFLQFFRFEVNGIVPDSLIFRTPSVRFCIFVIDDKQCGFGGGRDVTCQGFQIFPRLGFLDDDHLVTGHHWKPSRGFNNGDDFGILSVEDRLVESFFSFREHILLDKVRDDV